MALPANGRITATNITTELGVSKSGFRLAAAGPRGLAGIGSGRIKFSNFYGKASIIDFLLSSNLTDINLFSIAGSPTQAGKFRFTIASGVTVGQVNAAAALIVGQFPTGSTIDIVNNGNIYAKGGLANGGVGGDAIKADYPNQTVTISNTGRIYGGGGGGGRGGVGGVGGTGGGGYYENVAWGFSLGSPTYYWELFEYYSAITLFYNGTKVANGSSQSPTPGLDWNTTAYGPYRRGNQRSSQPIYDTKGAYMGVAYYYDIGYATGVYTSGGSGGAGGAGGSGTRGRGYDNQAGSLTGITGSAGTLGGGGGTNAGVGGQGGQGGGGGAGGDWGAPGAAGANGNVGATGAAGNNGGGAAGGAGAVGSNAGSAGCYLVKGGAAVTLTNSGAGAVAGRLV